MSFPFRNKIFTFSQPDGITIQVRGTGDQHYAVFETLDGYTVIEDPVTGFYQYATLKNDELEPTGLIPDKFSPETIGLTKGVRDNRIAVKSKVYSTIGLPLGNPRWKIRREEAKLASLHSLFSLAIALAPPQWSTVGDFIGLCLLIQFPDVPGSITQEEVTAFCNQEGYNEFGNNGSVYDYFFQNSGGKLRYTNIVAPYYTAKHPRSFYTNQAIPNTVRAIELIKEALEYHKSKSFDFSQLTPDSEDNIYALNVFYAGDVVNEWPKGLWPHQSNLPAPYRLMSGEKAFDYQITNLGNELSLGTFCHEIGHLLCDFPGLYDTSDPPLDGNNNDPRGLGVDDYCLIGFGGNADEKNPVQVGAYLKFKAGWANQVTEINARLDAEINAGSNDFYLYSKHSTEYFIIEHRNQDDRDNALPDSGLAI